MKFSFFDWIREGVKQSVLLGISDAAENIGTPAEVEQLNQRFLSTFQSTRLLGDQSAAKTSRSRRKALGRSLSTIIEDEKAS